jgi:hypothetical protein
VESSEFLSILNKFQLHFYTFSILNDLFSTSSGTIRVLQGSEVRLLHYKADFSIGRRETYVQRGGKQTAEWWKNSFIDVPQVPLYSPTFSLFSSSPQTSLIHFILKKSGKLYVVLTFVLFL